MMTALLGTSLVPGKTLIFFDEIQECPDARTAIKFLVEDVKNGTWRWTISWTLKNGT